MAGRNRAHTRAESNIVKSVSTLDCWAAFDECFAGRLSLSEKPAGYITSEEHAARYGISRDYAAYLLRKLYREGKLDRVTVHAGRKHMYAYKFKDARDKTPLGGNEPGGTRWQNLHPMFSKWAICAHFINKKRAKTR